MKFRSPTNASVYIGLTTGHTITIGPDLVEVPVMFRRKAIAEGCLPEGVEDAPPPEVVQKNKADLIIEAMRRMIAGADEADFNNDGKPDVRRLSKAAGFEVSRDERDGAWSELGDD